MAKEKYISAYNIAKKLTEAVKTSRNLHKNSDAFYFVALKYHLGLNENEIDHCITDLSYGLATAPIGESRDNGIDAIYMDSDSDTVYLYNFKYQESPKYRNYPSDECDKVLSYLDILLNFEDETNYYLNGRLQNLTKEIAEFMSDNIIQIKVVFASNYFEGLERTKKDLFVRNLEEKNSNITFEEFHLNDLMQKYLNRARTKYIGRCPLNRELIFPQKTNQSTEFIIAKVNALSLLKLFLMDKSKRESKNSILPADIVGSKIDDQLFDDNVRIFLTKNNKTNQKIISTAKKQPEDFFYYNNGITIICDSCQVTSGTECKLTLTNYQVVNGGQTIHSIFEAAKSDYNCLGKIDVLCRIFAGTDELHQRKIARFTNTQTLVTDRDLSSLDYIQMLLNEEFELSGLKYERKKNQYKGFARKIRFDSHKTGQLLLAYKLGKPHIARSSKKEVFAEAYVDKVFDQDVTAESIIKLYLLDAWLRSVSTEYKTYCRNAWLYVLYFYRLVYEKFKVAFADVKDSDVLDIDFNNPCAYARRCYQCTFRVLKHIVEKRKQVDPYYDDSNYFKTELPIKDFNDTLQTFGATLEDIESAGLTVDAQTVAFDGDE